MAFKVLSSYSTVKVLPGDLVFDAEYVTIRTLPTGITASYAVPIDAWRGDAGPALLGEIATGIEDLVSTWHVIGGSATQDLDDAGFLADYVDLIVAYTQPEPLGTLTGVAHVLVDSFVNTQTGIGGLITPGSAGATPADVVSAEYERLAALAGG